MQRSGSPVSACESVAVVALALSGHVISVAAYQGWLGAGCAVAATSLV
jgi:hypothetical protein